jgi:hypothetical protein
MFWNDIEDIKKSILEIKERLNHIERGVVQNLEVFQSEDEHSTINRLHGKLDELVRDADHVQEALAAEKTMDKFEGYMKNVDKLNAMINDFKGCVSMARGAISEGKEFAKEVEDMKSVAATSKQIYAAMQRFIQAGDNMEQKAFYKIDAIYKEICEYHVKKRRRRRKTKSCSTQSIS